MKHLYDVSKEEWPIRPLSEPNVLLYDDGSLREIRVMKHLHDVSKDGNGIFSSKFRSIINVPPPSSSGWRHCWWGDTIHIQKLSIDRVEM